MEEETLTGGNSTVVRVGETVRRTAGPWTPTIRRLLDTLRAAGLTEVPEPLGLDEAGRESLAFLPGVVPGYPMPAWVWDEALLREAGELLRRIHDASVSVLDQPGVWQLPAHRPVEVVCHNDVAPYNMVFSEHHLIGLIDFDTASPGPRLWDLAYLAYRLVPFSSEPGQGLPPEDQQLERLASLITAYGWPFDPVDVLAMAATRLDDLAEYTDRRAAATSRSDLLEHAALYRRDRDGLLERVAASRGGSA